MKKHIKPKDMTPGQKAYCKGVIDAINKLRWKVPAEYVERLPGYATDLLGCDRNKFDVEIIDKNETFKIKGLR